MKKRARRRTLLGFATIAFASMACERVTILGEQEETVDGGLLPSNVGARGDAATAAPDAGTAYALPPAPAGPGLFVNGLQCTPTRRTTTGTYFWSTTIEASCPDPWGNVKILMNGRRDVEYPTYCSESESTALYVYGQSETDGRLYRAYRSEGPYPPCAFFSGPGADAGPRLDDGSAATVFRGQLVLAYPFSPNGSSVEVSYLGP